MKQSYLFIGILLAMSSLQLAHAEINTITPVGTVLPFSGNSSSVPDFWLLADGSSILKSEYPDLFNLIGTTYGAGNSTHFVLPNLKQRFVLGKADSGTGSTLGETGGTINHLHNVDIPSFTSGTPSAVTPTSLVLGEVASATHTHTVNPPATNSTTNNPPYIAMNYIIKAKQDDLQFDPIDLECESLGSFSTTVACVGTSRYLNGSVRNDITFTYTIYDSTFSNYASGSASSLGSGLWGFSFNANSTEQSYYAVIQNTTYGWADTKLIPIKQLTGLTVEQNATLYNTNNVTSTIYTDIHSATWMSDLASAFWSFATRTLTEIKQTIFVNS